jgi:DNA-binding GntR family transcriptional regulator
VTPDDVKQIFEIRAVLEGLAAGLAAAHWSGSESSAAQILLAQQEAAAREGNLALSSQMNKQFHELVIQRANNRMLASMLRNLDDHLRRYRTISSYQKGRLEKSVAEHQQVLQALKQNDAAGAETLMRAHLRSVLEDLIHRGMFEEQG